MSPIFVVQKHKATHLHYDFRLQINKVLKSWAVPKQPPLRTGIKRLAIQVADHALSYAKFQGTIEEGYGAGTVEIWDKGTYELIKKTKNELEFELKGKKLKGKYFLIKFPKAGPKNWLFFKATKSSEMRVSS
jgi:DNA ligase D-like protein (predicted 3'-phosphoesterase)